MVQKKTDVTFEPVFNLMDRSAARNQAALDDASLRRLKQAQERFGVDPAAVDEETRRLANEMKDRLSHGFDPRRFRPKPRLN